MDDIQESKIVHLNTPIKWHSPQFLKPDKAGEFTKMMVHLMLGKTWVVYCLDLMDSHCPFDNARLFKEISSSGRVKPYVAPTHEKLLQHKRQMMMVQRFQFKAAAAEAGLLDPIKSAIESAPVALQVAYEEATTFSRLGSLIKFVQEKAALSDDQLDNLFKAAQKVPLV